MDGWKQVAEMALHYEHAKWRVRRQRWKYWKEEFGFQYGHLMPHDDTQRRIKKKKEHVVHCI
jgi:hypothetical protein